MLWCEGHMGCCSVQWVCVLCGCSVCVCVCDYKGNIRVIILTYQCRASVSFRPELPLHWIHKDDLYWLHCQKNNEPGELFHLVSRLVTLLPKELNWTKLPVPADQFSHCIIESNYKGKVTWTEIAGKINVNTGVYISLFWHKLQQQAWCVLYFSIRLDLIYLWSKIIFTLCLC